MQALDEWPGEDYDGTSVRAFYKWLKVKGFITEYRWAFDCETVINHVLGIGPVQMGTIWDESMSNPDRWGYIYPNTRSTQTIAAMPGSLSGLTAMLATRTAQEAG